MLGLVGAWAGGVFTANGHSTVAVAKNEEQPAAPQPAQL